MTKWNRSETSLKSSAYNHNGQNYFEQLTTYNSMSSHLRRVLLAKCVIDSRNKNCVTRRKQFYKQIECKPHFTKRKITDDLIDRLAYDTLHHPADVVQMHYDSRYSCHDEDQRYSPDCYDHDSICPQSSLLHDHVICSRSPGFKPNKYQTIQKDNHDMDERCTRTNSKDQDIRCRYTEDSIYYESISDIRTTKNNHVSARCDEDCKATHVTGNPTGNPQHSGKWEEAKYVNFVYEITREILHNHFYTDDQLREVFKRHIEKNKEHLDVNKMMFEICQLKNALNVVDELDDEDIYVKQPRPPTPPKVLDENKVLEKLMLYCSDKTSKQRHSTTSNKSVVLVDANPEMMLTERDVLTSLIESDINPDAAQKIYRRLFSRSKEFIHGFPDLVYTRTAGSSDSDAESVNDRLDPMFEESSDLNKANEQEKGSTTQDLITQADKDVQVKCPSDDTKL